MFKGDDDLSFAFLDAFAEVNQEYKPYYTFNDPSKTLFFSMGNNQLIIFGFNYQKYLDSIEEDFNAFEDCSPDINAEKDINAFEDGSHDINVEKDFFNLTFPFLLCFILIWINFLLIPIFNWMIDGSTFTPFYEIGSFYSLNVITNGMKEN